MESTSFIRRLDDFGRVVIPKEMRRSLNLHDGDAVSLRQSGEGIVIKKHSPLIDFERTARLFCIELSRAIDKTCLITDKDKIISTSDTERVSALNDSLALAIYTTANERKMLGCIEIEGIGVVTLCPIFAVGEVVGTIIVVHEGEAVLEQIAERTLKFVAQLLGYEIEQH